MGGDAEKTGWKKSSVAFYECYLLCPYVSMQYITENLGHILD